MSRDIPPLTIVSVVPTLFHSDHVSAVLTTLCFIGQPWAAGNARKVDKLYSLGKLSQVSGEGLLDVAQVRGGMTMSHDRAHAYANY